MPPSHIKKIIVYIHILLYLHQTFDFINILQYKTCVFFRINMNKGIIGIFLILLLLSFTQEESHPFEKVILAQKNKATIKRLKDFRKGGIELPLVFKCYAPDTTGTDSLVDIEKIIKTAEGFLGTKHRMGGTSKRGIDCSGMVMMSLRSCGIATPHNSHGQARYGRIIPHMDSLRRGDLVFYINSFKSSYLITHSGICLGNGKFIHASASCGVVITDLSAPYWKSKFVFGTRLTSAEMAPLPLQKNDTLSINP